MGSRLARRDSRRELATMLKESEWPSVDHQLNAAFKMRTVLAIGKDGRTNNGFARNVREQEYDSEQGSSDDRWQGAARRF